MLPEHLRFSCRHAALLSMALSMAACGSQSNASAPADEASPGTVRPPAAPTRPAAASTDLPPAALAAWEAYARQQCRLDEARFVAVRFAPLAGSGPAIEQIERQFGANKGGFITANFNGDGKPDFLVATPNHGCAVQGPPYGNAGPPHDFILSTASGYQVAEGFGGWVGPSMIKRRGQREVIEYDGGGFNGRCGRIATAVWGWNGQRMDVVERRDDRGRIVDQEGCAVSAQPPASRAASGSFPPIPQGYYAYGTSCARAVASGDANNPPAGLTHFDAKYFGEWDGAVEIRGFENLGNNRYRVRAISEGNGGTGEKFKADFTIRVTGAASFIDEESGTSHTHCPTSMVPRAIRSSWYGEE